MRQYKEVEGIDATTYAGKAALAVKTKARGILGDDLLIFKLMDIVSLMLINNKFANKGIFITDDNKEESYIKIIETGDESLITDLEKYLILKDDIKKIEASKEEYSGIIKQLHSLANSDDEEAVNKIVEEYLRR
jgi:succinate dehydrogenase flavin-adding protein (antitoxin of CptAB toxin-antitoxin module)